MEVVTNSNPNMVFMYKVKFLWGYFVVSKVYALCVFYGVKKIVDELKQRAAGDGLLLMKAIHYCPVPVKKPHNLVTY